MGTGVMSRWDKGAVVVSLVILAVAIGTITAYAAMPQFPNFFYGEATLNGEPVPGGAVVTAVVNHGEPNERHYSLEVTQDGQYGGAKYNQAKLKVGGDQQGDIAHLSPIKFFVTQPLTGATTLEFNTSMAPAGEAMFYADSTPHVTDLDLDQQ